MVLGLVAAAYVGVPQAGYVWDDHALVERNRILLHPTLTDIFARDLWCCTVGSASGYFRPLLTVSFLLDRWTFGTGSAGPHLHSVLWHLLVVTLVAYALRDRVGDLRANVAALLFGLHPVSSEAIVWISARNDLMAAAGVIGCLVAFDRNRLLLGGLAALAACLSKENAHLLPLVLFAWRRAWGESVRPKEWVALGLALALAIALRANAEIGGMSLDEGDIGVTPRTVLNGAVHFVSLLVAPWPLTSTLSVYVPPPSIPRVLAALGSIALLVSLVVIGRARAAWLLLVGAVVLAPAALGVRWYGTFGERYYYLPLLGVCTAAVASVPAWRGWTVVTGLLTVAALAILHVRVPEWADEETLFTAAVRRVPDGYSWNLLGVELIRQERWAEATAALDTAIAKEPIQRRACRHVVGSAERIPLPDDLLLSRSRLWSDEGCKGLGQFDGSLAMALASRGLWEEAQRAANEAVRADPDRRDEIVRAAVDARSMDLDALGARAMAWPSGAADLLDQVAYLTNAVQPSVAPGPTPQ
jgi:tetratricopeptide (TPR) repeat protein